jgi:cysteinyl-tRNA synthetase
MIEVKMSLEKIEEFLRKLKSVKVKSKTPESKVVKNILLSYKEKFYENLQDDFNTPKAFASLFELISEINKHLDNQTIGKNEALQIYAFFEELNKIFDIIDFKKLKKVNVPAEVLELVKAREHYRKLQEWQKADEARHEIGKYGYVVDDTKDGPVLKKI